jgi:hypothetical protein
MRTLPVFCLAAVLVPSLAGKAAAQDDPGPIIEKAIKALGGEEVLGRGAAAHTRVKSSFIGIPGGGAIPGIDFAGEMWSQAGSERMSMVITLAGQKMNMTRVRHGGKGWQQDDANVTDMPAGELEEAKQSEYVDRVLGLLPLLKEKGFTLKALGKQKVDGAELLGVRVSSAGRSDVTLWFDPEAGYPKRVEYRTKSAALGKEVATAVVLDDYRAIDPAAEEERALKAAKVATDAAGLLEFLRRQARTGADLDKVRALVKRLGDDSFEEREKATEALIALGSAALPELRRATKDSDAEVASRAKRCVDKIAEVSGPEGLLTAALRLVAMKRPPGAAEVLLALAPTLTDEADAREVRGALAAVALRDGKPDRAVEKALEDKDPARKAAAAAALGKDGGAFEKQPGRRVFVTGLKRAMKSTYYQDGEKQLVLEVIDVELYNRFDDKLFAKPK